jgi:predicted acetyltransferase
MAVVEIDGRPEAYALYRHRPSWEQGSSTAKLTVVEAIGATPRGTAEIWRFLLDIDWQATVEAYLMPVDHPLFFLLAEPRRMKYRMGDGLWVRLVDVGAALSARSYADDSELVIDVVDGFAPWNAGRWKLANGACERTDDEADLRCDVSTLGSVYLGGFSFRELFRAFRVEELRDGAIDRADAIFRRTSVAPWCPEIF